MMICSKRDYCTYVGECVHWYRHLLNETCHGSICNKGYGLEQDNCECIDLKEYEKRKHYFDECEFEL